MRKRPIIIAFISILAFIIIFFMQNAYKKINPGNNILSKTTSEIVDTILNMQSYNAKLTVKIVSNKNENKYVLKQKNISDKKYKQEILEPENIRGTIISYDTSNLKIENTRLKLSKIYENYPYLTQNELLLNSFIEDYKQRKRSVTNRK